MAGGRNNPWIVIAFLSLYCATQGLYDAWDEAFELTYLTGYGVSLEYVGLTQTLAIVPWCFKVYVSMPSDIMRMRLPFCALGLLISGTMFLAITNIDPKTMFVEYCLAMMFRNFGIALADGATEGFSVDCKLDDISGTMQAWMQVGRMTGMIIGAAVGGQLCKTSYTDCLIFLGTAILVFIPVNFLVNEESDPLPYDPHRSWGALFLPFLYPKEVVERNLNFIKAADEAREVEEAKLKALLNIGKDGGAAGSDAAAESKGLLLEDGAAADGSSKPSKPASDGSHHHPHGHPEHHENHHIGGEHDHPDKKLVDGDNEFQILLALVKKTPVWCFILYVFITNLGTYIASFPIVPYLEDKHSFEVDEIGYLTVIGCVGNMAASFLFGYLFDYISSKRLVLFLAALVSAGTYLFFLPAKTKGELFMAQFTISAGAGLLYTVHCAMVRLLADERIGGSFFGVVLSSQNIAALIGTAVGGVIAAVPKEQFGGSGLDGYEWCYMLGFILGVTGVLLVPWISSQDPNLRDESKKPLGQALSQSYRKLKRRASQYLGLPVPPDTDEDGEEGGPDGGGKVVPNPLSGPAGSSSKGSSLTDAAPTSLTAKASQPLHPAALARQRAEQMAALAASGDDAAAAAAGGTWLPPMGSMRNIVGAEGKGIGGLINTGVWDKVRGKQAAEQRAAEQRAMVAAAANRALTLTGPPQTRHAGEIATAYNSGGGDRSRGGSVVGSLEDRSGSGSGSAAGSYSAAAAHHQQQPSSYSGAAGAGSGVGSGSGGYYLSTSAGQDADDVIRGSHAPRPRREMAPLPANAFQHSGASVVSSNSGAGTLPPPPPPVSTSAAAAAAGGRPTSIAAAPPSYQQFRSEYANQPASAAAVAASHHPPPHPPPHLHPSQHHQQQQQYLFSGGAGGAGSMMPPPPPPVGIGTGSYSSSSGIGVGGGYAASGGDRRISYDGGSGGGVAVPPLASGSVAHHLPPMAARGSFSEFSPRGPPEAGVAAGSYHGASSFGTGGGGGGGSAVGSLTGGGPLSEAQRRGRVERMGAHTQQLQQQQQQHHVGSAQ